MKAKSKRMKLMAMLLALVLTAGELGGAGMSVYAAESGEDMAAAEDEITSTGLTVFAAGEEDVSSETVTEEAYGVGEPYCIKGVSNTRLGTSVITSPSVPASDEDRWSGSHVYFGKDAKEGALIWKVLDPETTEYNSKKTMLLDCNVALDRSIYGEDCGWKDSELKEFLNGNGFYNKSGVFTELEKAAIATSTKATIREGYDFVNKYADCKFEPLCGEKIFVLDYAEAHRESYGFKGRHTREKVSKYPETQPATYWLRSIGTGDRAGKAKIVDDWGNIGGGFAETTSAEHVSPTFNLDLSTVLFSTAHVPNLIGENNTFKLTLKDESLKVTSKGYNFGSGNTIFVPYTVNDTSRCNNISFVVTDKKYTDEDAKILVYRFLDLDGTDLAENGTGTINLVNDYERELFYGSGEAGKDYHVYLLAENTNIFSETDYASLPVEIFESNIKYDLWVGGTQVTSGNQDDILGDGKANYNPATNTLTFNNATISSTYTSPKSGKTMAIRSENMPLTIDGMVNINTPGADFAIDSYTVGTSDNALTLDGDITINGGGVGILTESMDLAFASGKVDIKNTSTSAVKVGLDRKVSFGDGMDIVSPAGAALVTKDKITEIREGNGSVYPVVKTATIGKMTGYNLWVNGTEVTESNKSSIPCGSGSASYDPTTNTLTFTDATITEGFEFNSGSKAGIYSRNNALTIKGDLTIDSTDLNAGIYCYDLEASDRALNLEGDIKIKAKQYGVNTVCKSVEIAGGKLDIEAGRSALNVNGDVTLGKGVKVVTPEGGVIKNVSGYSRIFESESATSPVKNAVIGGDVEEPIYTVTFDLNGKTGTAPSAQTVKEGKKATEPTAPTVEGFTFGGWYTASTCKDSEKYNFSTPVTGDITLYAGWKEAEKFKVVFNANGKTATDMPADQEVKEGKTATAPSKEPKVEGFKFGGWYADSEGKKPFDFTAPISKDTTVYARWIDKDKETFTVTFNANGHGTAPAAQTVEKEASAADPGMLKADGYKFTGWYTDAECKNKYSFSTPVTANIMLYAGWVEYTPVIISDGDVWNLYEDISEHVFDISGIYASGTKANINAKSKNFYYATLTGSTISVKVTGDRKKAAAAANTTLEFNLGEDGIVEYILPVSYMKPAFKLSPVSSAIREGSLTTVRTRLLYKAPGGNFEPYDMTGVSVSGLDGIAVASDGTIEITGSKKQSGNITVTKDGWDSSNPVKVKYSIKTATKDVLDVDLQGLKTVTLNTNAKDQSFEYAVTLNGVAGSKDTVQLEDKKSCGLAEMTDTGKLKIAYKDGTAAGNYTVTLKTGTTKVNVKIKVSGTPLDSAVTGKIQSKLDVVTGQEMVVIPTLKEVGGMITGASVTSPADFTARVNEAGNIVIGYTGDKYDIKNLKIGEMKIALTISGISTPVALTLKGVSAQKTTPIVKAAQVNIPANVAPADDKVIGTANILSTYKTKSGAFRTVSPVKVEIYTAKCKNVDAKVNATDKTEIDIIRLSAKSGSVPVTVTYPGGMTKKLTIKVKAK